MCCVTIITDNCGSATLLGTLIAEVESLGKNNIVAAAKLERKQGTVN